MSDHNATRQARQTVAQKSDLLGKIDSLAKSLDGEEVAPEATVEETPAEVVAETPVEAVVETPAEVAVEETEKAKKPAKEDDEDEEKCHKAKAKKAEMDNDEDEKEKCNKGKKKEEDDKEEEAKKAKKPAKEEDDEEEKCHKSTAEVAVEKLTAFLSDNLIPMIKSLQKSFTELSDTVAKSQSITKSFHEDKFTEISKTQDELQKNVVQMAHTVEMIAKSAQPRKSVATFTALEKSFTKDEANLSMEDQIMKKMDEGMSYAEARTFVVKSSMNQ